MYFFMAFSTGRYGFPVQIFHFVKKISAKTLTMAGSASQGHGQIQKEPAGPRCSKKRAKKDKQDDVGHQYGGHDAEDAVTGVEDGGAEPGQGVAGVGEGWGAFFVGSERCCGRSARRGSADGRRWRAVEKREEVRHLSYVSS